MKGIADNLPEMAGSRDNPALASMDKMLQETHYPKRTGELIFDCPITMKRGKEYNVQTKISAHLEQIITKSKSGIYEIPISDIMMCTLKGDSFKINPVNNNSTQLILANQITNWYWNVTPLKSGFHNLLLSVAL
jgi:hypothetical protein